MDIEKLAAQVLGSIKDDKNQLNEFSADPIKLVRSILGNDIADDIIRKVIALVTTQLGEGAMNVAKDVAGKAAEDKGGILDGLKGLFGKN